MSFREQPPANLGNATTEADPAAQLFSAAYVFGAPTYNIENEPGPSDLVSGATSTLQDEPIDLTEPASQEPTPAALGGPNTAGGNAKWFFWPSGQSTLVVSTPNGSDIRSLWFPGIDFAVAISLGQAPGNVMYTVAPFGAELVAIPSGSASAALTTTAPGPWSGVWVLCSGQPFAPSRVDLTAERRYNVTLISNPGNTLCPGVAGGPAEFLIGVINLSNADQSSNGVVLTIYDNNIGDGSGNVVAQLAPLGPSQIITFPAPGIPLQFGCNTVLANYVDAFGLQVLTR